MEPEMQVCKCMHMWTSKCMCVCECCITGRQHLSLSLSLQRGRLLSADKSVQIMYFRALTLSQALSADSPVGCVSPALGDINTPLMSPFLEESRNNRQGWSGVEEGWGSGGGGAC